MVYEGKVTYRVGPLQAAEGEKPCFAQLYVHDPSLETGLRLSGKTIPAGTSTRQKKILQQVLVWQLVLILQLMLVRSWCWDCNWC